MAMTPRDAYLRRTYGLTEEEYLLLLEYQGGVCFICRRTPKGNLHVDHDHRTGIIRGLLCMPCNHDLLGRRDRDPGLFTRAAAYLTTPPAVDLLGPRAAPKRKPTPRRNAGKGPSVVKAKTTRRKR